MADRSCGRVPCWSGICQRVLSGRGSAGTRIREGTLPAGALVAPLFPAPGARRLRHAQPGISVPSPVPGVMGAVMPSGMRQPLKSSSPHPDSVKVTRVFGRCERGNRVPGDRTVLSAYAFSPPVMRRWQIGPLLRPAQRHDAALPYRPARYVSSSSSSSSQRAVQGHRP